MGGLALIEVAGRFGQPPLSVAPGGGFPYVGFPGVGFACLPCTMAAEGDVDPAFGDCARVGCGRMRAYAGGSPESHVVCRVFGG